MQHNIRDNYTMSTHVSNNHDEDFGVDKFDGSFENEELGCTIIVNETINLIVERCISSAGLYSYLLARPKNWRLNVKHLSTLLKCNKEKIYKIIYTLIDIGVMTRSQSREKGKFARFHYRTHLRPKKTQLVQITPRPEKPDTVKPDTVFPDTYKTNILLLKNKEGIETTTQQDESSGSFFSKKNKTKILKLKLDVDDRSDDLFLLHAQYHLENKSDLSKGMYQRIAMLCSLLTKLKEIGEIFKAVGFNDKPKKDYSKETDKERQDRQFFQYELDKERQDPKYISKALKKFPEMREKYAI